MIHWPVRPKDPETELGGPLNGVTFTFTSTHTWHQHPLEFTVWARELGVVPAWGPWGQNM